MQAARFRPLGPALAFLAAAGALRAQSCNSEVLAFADPFNQLWRVDNVNCTSIPCPTGLGTLPQLYAGGVAHDPRDRATWVSDGALLVKIDRFSCLPVCGPFPAPNLPAGVVVTGLAVNEMTQQLFVSHSNNTILTYLAVGCTLVLQNTCAVTVPANHVIGGLATDDPANTLFYVSGPFLGTGAPAQLVVTPQGSPCTPLCGPMTPLVGCNGTLVLLPTGLGYDACRSELYIAERGAISTFATAYWPLCSPVNIGCCQVPPAPQNLRGLCVLPHPETSSGGICFTASLPPCFGMQHVLRGDPTIGNFGFGLDLINAPGNTLAFLRINIGGCAPNTNFGGILCGFVPMNNLCIFVPTGGTTGLCNGQAQCNFPIPPLPLFCGITLSTAYFGVAGSVFTNYTSNCLTWQICAS